MKSRVKNGAPVPGGPLGLRKAPRDRRHDEVERPDGRAERDPAVLVDLEAERGRESRGENRRHAPVTDALRAARRRDEAGDVGRRSREEAGPEEAVKEREADQKLPALRECVCGREARDREARDEEHPAPAEPVRERAGERRRQSRGIREKAKKQAGGDRRTAQLEDPERRRRQKLEERCRSLRGGGARRSGRGSACRSAPPAPR